MVYAHVDARLCLTPSKQQQPGRRVELDKHLESARQLLVANRVRVRVVSEVSRAHSGDVNSD